MTKKAQLGRELYEAGYSCSEATWLAFNQDLSKEFLDFGLKLAGGFGGGFSSGKVCGAISGIVLSLGKKYGRNLGEEKSELLREKVKMLINYTEEIYQSVDCEELRPAIDHQPFCAELVEKLITYAETLMD